jgi:hypothetical protein
VRKASSPREFAEPEPRDEDATAPLTRGRVDERPVPARDVAALLAAAAARDEDDVFPGVPFS